MAERKEQNLGEPQPERKLSPEEEENEVIKKILSYLDKVLEEIETNKDRLEDKEYQKRVEQIGLLKIQAENREYNSLWMEDPQNRGKLEMVLLLWLEEERDKAKKAKDKVKAKELSELYEEAFDQWSLSFIREKDEFKARFQQRKNVKEPRKFKSIVRELLSKKEKEIKDKNEIQTRIDEMKKRIFSKPLEQGRSIYLYQEILYKEYSPEILSEKIEILKEILQQERENGRGKLKDTIEEIKRSPAGNEYFVDGSVAYLPEKGKAFFIGDIHGDPAAVASIVKQTQFIESMEKGEKDIFLVFLGDYTDRGRDDILAMTEIIDLKLHYPKNVILLRGNHEEVSTGWRYGLLRNLICAYGKKRGKKLFLDYMIATEKMPGILVTANGIVGVHGGIPNQDIKSLKDLNNENFLYQMRWNDPVENIKERIGSCRGDKLTGFGRDPFNRFMEAIGGNVMIRGHQAKREGACLIFDRKLATIFSNGTEKSPYTGYPKVDAKFAKLELDHPKEVFQQSDFISVDYLPLTENKEILSQPEEEPSPEEGKENRPQEEGLDHMTNEDLCYMIAAGLGSETEQAWQELLRRGPTDDDLRQLIGPARDYTPLSIVKQAARKLLEREPPNEDLCRIIVAEADQSIAEEAWQKLSERGPTDDDLRDIISGAFLYEAPPSIKKQASQELLKREPPNDDLCCIIVANAGQPIAEEAWQKLSERGAINKDLCHVIGVNADHSVDQSIAEQAWQELLEQGPTYDDLWDIINSSHVPPSIKEQAQKLYYLGEPQPEQELSPEEKKEREIQELALGYLNKLSEKLENKREKTKDKSERRLLQEKIKRLDLFMGQVQRREYFSVEVEGHKSDSVYDFFEKVYEEGKKEGKELKKIKEIIDGLNSDYIREKFDQEKRDILEKSFRQYLIEEGEIKEKETEPEIEAEGILGERAIQEILNNPDVTKETDPEKRKEKIAYYIFQERIKQGKGVAHLDNRFGKFNENSAKAYRDWDWYNAAMLLEREKKESRPISGPKTESEPIPISKPEPPPEPSIEPTPEPTEEPPKPEPVELPEEPEKKGKKRKGKTWGFIKERLKGFFTIGFWEFHQAEKFRSVTRKVGKKIAKQERLLKKKEELKESSKKELEKMGLSGPVLEQALSQIEDKRIKDNERVVDLIVKNARKK